MRPLSVHRRVYRARVWVCPLQVYDVGADVTELPVHDLFPTSTYEFRVRHVVGSAMSPPSKATAADTLAAGCGGKKKERSCVVS